MLYTFVLGAMDPVEINLTSRDVRVYHITKKKENIPDHPLFSTLILHKKLLPGINPYQLSLCYFTRSCEPYVERKRDKECHAYSNDDNDRSKETKTFS
jgi:hypothetical protein